ncbi:hypothetical protein EVAR_63285_1 [Eumeta japonica]|uniref:Uncharacterized protein n=1 Tax=Eumeta variegata TaxID=151549 RepID=A0A4C2A0X7_EUMVA|nr:hypothetical protein EVAR_63285_1 [Eumeta japonica]
MLWDSRRRRRTAGGVTDGACDDSVFTTARPITRSYNASNRPAFIAGPRAGGFSRTPIYLLSETYSFCTHKNCTTEAVSNKRLVQFFSGFCFLT